MIAHAASNCPDVRWCPIIPLGTDVTNPRVRSETAFSTVAVAGRLRAIRAVAGSEAEACWIATMPLLLLTLFKRIPAPAAFLRQMASCTRLRPEVARCLWMLRTQPLVNLPQYAGQAFGRQVGSFPGSHLLPQCGANWILRSDAQLAACPGEFSVVSRQRRGVL
jgi:hypothetical protein